MQRLIPYEKSFGRWQGYCVFFRGKGDSTFLLQIAHEELGEDALEVTADSPIHSTEEYGSACKIGRSFKIKHIVIETHELNNPTFWNKPSRACLASRFPCGTSSLVLKR